MEKFLIDSDLIVNILTYNEEKHSDSIDDLVSKVDYSKMTLIVINEVILETANILKKTYNISNEDISESLIRFLKSNNVEYEEPFIIEALEKYKNNDCSLIDIVASIKAEKQNAYILTTNTRDYKKISTRYFTYEEVKQL